MLWLPLSKLISFLAFDSGLFIPSINPCSKHNNTGVKQSFRVFQLLFGVILMSFSKACWWTELAFLQDNRCFQQLLLLYFFATNKLTRPPCDSFVLIKPGTKGKNFSHSFHFNCCYFLAPGKKFCSKRVFEQFERTLLAWKNQQVYVQPAYCDSR